MPIMTPEQIAASGTEEAHQKAFMQWIALEGVKLEPLLDRMFHIPNGGDRSPSVAAAMKAGGVKRGVPDLCWPVPIGIYAGLWIELKKPGVERYPNGARSIDQVEWARFLVERGYAVFCCYGWEARATAAMRYWAKPDLPMGETGSFCGQVGFHSIFATDQKTFLEKMKKGG